VGRGDGPLVGGAGGGPSLPFMSPPHHGVLSSLHAIVVVVVACCRPRRVLPGLRCVVVGHLVLGLANSKGEGGLTSLLFIVWWPCRRLRRGTWVAIVVASHRCGRSFGW